jgi:hypothetical protein
MSLVPPAWKPQVGGLQSKADPHKSMKPYLKSK